MPSLRGERFHVDLSSDDDDDDAATLPRQPSGPALGLGMVRDISERPLASVNGHVAPTLNKTEGGFPIHKRRINVSKFKSQKAQEGLASAEGAGRDVVSTNNVYESPKTTLTEKESIDRENNQRLAQMSETEISKEQQELLNGLTPALVKKLLSRANTSKSGVPMTDDLKSKTPQDSIPAHLEKRAKTVNFDDNAHTLIQDSHNIESENNQSTTTSIHFPRPPQPPEPNAESASFFDDLHDKYFPELPADPSKLAWMSESSDDASPYSPTASSISIPALRFAFDGRLLAPRTSNLIPVSEGLHHHGDAPNSAGYTIPELARLSRSAFPAQRSMAFQTLGRLMFRLGSGEFGSSSKGDDDLADGLWRCIDQGRVLDTLNEEVKKPGGHASAKAHATEALWLWRKGGGSRWSGR